MFKTRKRRIAAGEVEWPTMENGKPLDGGKVERLPNGMRILDRHTIQPIHMYKGDLLQCTYNQTFEWDNRSVHTKSRKLAEYVCEEDHIIDTVIILELDNGSVEALGLEYGLAGVFGTAKAV